MRKNLVLGLLISTGALTPQFAFAAGTVSAEELKARPDATVTFEARQVRILLGGGSGTGVLHYKGKKYPFTMKAATVGGMGATDVKGTGNVFHLAKVEDFSGPYSAVGIGMALGEGKSSSAFQNEKGVVIQTKSKTTGAALNLGAGGVLVTLAK